MTSFSLRLRPDSAYALRATLEELLQHRFTGAPRPLSPVVLREAFNDPNLSDDACRILSWVFEHQDDTRPMS